MYVVCLNLLVCLFVCKETDWDETAVLGWVPRLEASQGYE